MYQKIISLVLGVLGLVMFIAPEYIINSETENQFLKQLVDYHQLVGLALVAGAYYIYSQMKPPSESSEITQSESESKLPSYEEATSEE